MSRISESTRGKKLDEVQNYTNIEINKITDNNNLINTKITIIETKLNDLEKAVN